MTKKIIFTFITLTTYLTTPSVFANTTNNIEIDISNIPQQCQLLFQQTEELIADAEKQPGTHTQIYKMKNKLNQSKKQILKMEFATQTRSCNHGLAKLNSLQQSE